MSIQTTFSAPSLTMRDILSATTVLSHWRNSKGRIMPLHLKSPPGTGKTMLPEQYVRAVARQYPGVPIGLAAHSPGVKTPADVAGYVLFDTIGGMKSSTYSRPDLFEVQRAITFHADSNTYTESTRDDEGRPIYWGSKVNGHVLDRGIVLLDEFDQADIEIRKVLAPLLDEGRITTHSLPVNVAVWAASNRAKDASGAGRGLAFLTNRQSMIEVEADKRMLSAYMQGIDSASFIEPLSATMFPVLDHRGRIVRDPTNPDSMAHPALMAFMNQNYALMTAGVPSDPNTPFLTARSFEAVSNLFEVCLRLPMCDESGQMDPSLTFSDSFIGRRSERDDMDPDAPTGDPTQRWRVFQALAGGTIGPENTAQFIATLELFDEIPTTAEIVKDPKKAKVSEKTDAQFIVSYQVSGAMTRGNGEALIAYAKRLNPSLYHNIIHNAVMRDGELGMLKSVNEFLQQNPDSMMRMMVMRANASMKQGGRA